MSNEVIKVVNVTKRFGRKTILNNVNLDIHSGEIFGIIGTSGSGKTTMLNTMIGFLQPDSGDVLFKIEHLLNYQDDDIQFKSVYSHETIVKNIFGFAAQMPSIYSKLTCQENLNYFGRLYNLPKDIRKTNIDILLKLMNLTEARNIQAGFLSGGMKKRLDIACALMHDPKVLILDEPTADLDPLLRRQMWHLMKEINKKGTTIIITSHFLDELERFCNRVCVLDDAKIIVTGTPHEIKNLYKKEQEVRLETASHNYSKLQKSLKDMESQLEIGSIELESQKIIISTAKAEEVLRKIIRFQKNENDAILDIVVEDPSLEYVLERITEGDNE